MTSPVWLSMRQVRALRTLSASSPDESNLLRDWLSMVSSTYDRFAFNVRLGEGRTPDPNDPPAIAAMWKACTQLRADCLARLGNDVDVIEAKVCATVDAATQVKRYVRLARHELAGVGLVRPVIVCRSADIAVDIVMHQEGGSVFRCVSSATVAAR